MKSLTKFYLIALCLAMTLGPCNKTEPDNEVVISYQHLANFSTWSLNGGGENQPNNMWHVYMLRGIVNKGKDAQPFTFDIQNLSTQNGETVMSSPTAMYKAMPVTMPTNFRVTVKPQAVYTIHFGTGALFFIKQDNDTEKTPVTPLFYRTRGKDNKLDIQKGVVMYMYDSNPVMYDHLDEAFLNKIHAKQNEYEANYPPKGSDDQKTHR